MNKLCNVFIFAIGAAVGSVVTWKIVKTKYERIAQEEIDSVKEVFSRRQTQEDIDDKIETESLNTKLEQLENYKDTLKTLKYNVENKKGPHIITQAEFGDGEYEYDLVSLNYYSDGILTDDFDVEIANAEAVIGEECLSLFGNPDVDIVYVRNDTLKTDYEILYCDEKFSEMIHYNPQDEEEEEE